jgi:RNA polymerase sigma factor (sigma-70 family)
MDDSQATRRTLLIRLQDGRDGQAWSDFVDIYSPVVYGFARKQGLQDADAADLVQEVLRSVTGSICGYDASRGPFRGWLMAVVRNRLCDFRRSGDRRVLGTGDTAALKHLEQVADADDPEAVWEKEYRQSVFRFAAVRVRECFEATTWRAFWLFSVDGKSAVEVAQACGITPGAVYIAKCRVLAQLKQVVQEVEK